MARPEYSRYRTYLLRIIKNINFNFYYNETEQVILGLDGDGIAIELCCMQQQ